jgi:hypothetical protein
MPRIYSKSANLPLAYRVTDEPVSQQILKSNETVTSKPIIVPLYVCRCECVGRWPTYNGIDAAGSLRSPLIFAPAMNPVPDGK